MPSTTRPAPNLQEKLTAAQREADELARELADAESAVALAVEEQRFADAEKAKATADAVRPHLALAQASVTALRQAAHDLDAHRRDAERAEQERIQREQAQQQMEEAAGRMRAAEDDVQRLLAEIGPALDAVRQIMHEAVLAEQRLGQARADGHTAGVAAGHVDPALPLPYPPRSVQSRLERDRLLYAIYHNKPL